MSHFIDRKRQSEEFQDESVLFEVEERRGPNETLVGVALRSNIDQKVGDSDEPMPVTDFSV